MLNFPYLWDEGSLGGGGVEIVTWDDGTDEQIVAMVEAADRGDIELTDYWAVNDERTVSLSAMAASGSNDYGSWTVGETHAAQNSTLVIMNEGYPVVGVDNSHVHFVVGMKNCLNEKGYMNSTNTSAGGWKNCARRGWCNSIFYASFPDTLKPIFKLFNTKTASTGNNNNASIDTLQDRFALFAEKEIFGSKTYCADSEATQLNQISYYITSSNRQKTNPSSSRDDHCYPWWERSPNCGDATTFCRVSSSGAAGANGAGIAYGLAPFGCI